MTTKKKPLTNKQKRIIAENVGKMSIYLLGKSVGKDTQEIKKYLKKLQCVSNKAVLTQKEIEKIERIEKKYRIGKHIKIEPKQRKIVNDNFIKKNGAVIMTEDSSASGDKYTTKKPKIDNSRAFVMNKDKRVQ